MANINLDQIISMTDLQKLSLKRLRKTKLPLLVVDQKSKRKGFVILDYPSYEAMTVPVEPSPASVQTPSAKRTSKVSDYRNMGLLWDRPDLTNDEFHRRLKEPSHPEYGWAFRRLLEYARSSTVTRLMTLQEIKSGLETVRLRPFFQETWNHAVQYWSQRP